MSASNDNFLPLAKGLWSSLLELGLADNYELAWVDIGNSDETRRWLSRHAPAVRQVNLIQQCISFVERLTNVAYHRALLLRPFLPMILPSADVIIWIDSDMWVQDRGSIDLFKSTVVAHPDAVAIAPILDVAYGPLFVQAEQFFEDNVAPVWSALYGESIAGDFSHRPLLSNGLFAIAGGSDIWAQWRNEIEKLWLANRARPTRYVHVAEQTALSYLLYTSSRFCVLEALHNFHANLGVLERNAEGIVTTGGPDRRRVGVVHLSDIGTAGMASEYVRRELLYRRGRYLDSSEREQLFNMQRI